MLLIYFQGQTYFCSFDITVLDSGSLLYVTKIM